jgi:hypothetical protein
MTKFSLLYLFHVFKISTLCLFLTSCTYSVTLVHTDGIASDVVDETATNTPSTTVSPRLSIPSKLI